MRRRSFLKKTILSSAALPGFARRGFSALANSDLGTNPPSTLQGDLSKDWLARWEKHILDGARSRYCDRELGEEIGWLISPFLNGFYYGYLATGDPKWVEHLVDWADSWIRRGSKEPDGFIGWPKSGTGGLFAKDLLTDSLLGEAMGLRPVVLMADEIQKSPELKARFGDKAAEWLGLAAKVFEKWDSRGCWREVKGGGVWVVPSFGMEEKTGRWTEVYARRTTDGFSNPDNKQNHIARWLLAMHDVTGQAVYRERAEKWFRLMRSRMKPQQDGKYFVWNYWEPAGPWDYNKDGSTVHWVGVHPNGGYYVIDLEGIVSAYEHDLVFTRDEIQKLVATNRDFMWNQQFQGAKFRRIDGGEPDSRWKDAPGLLWTPLVAYDGTLRKIFFANHDPSSWSGLATTPWYLARERSAKAIR
jgi:hypothetical protein